MQIFSTYYEFLGWNVVRRIFLLNGGGGRENFGCFNVKQIDSKVRNFAKF